MCLGKNARNAVQNEKKLLQNVKSGDISKERIAAFISVLSKQYQKPKINIVDLNWKPEEDTIGITNDLSVFVCRNQEIYLYSSCSGKTRAGAHQNNRFRQFKGWKMKSQVLDERMMRCMVLLLSCEKVGDPMQMIKKIYSPFHIYEKRIAYFMAYTMITNCLSEWGCCVSCEGWYGPIGDVDYIQCEKCEFWAHENCIPDGNRYFFSNELKFICGRCIKQ